MNMRITLILLAAGNSSRFGGDKLSIPINEVPMLSRALRLYAGADLQDCFLERILVTQSCRTSFIEEAQSLGYRVVINDSPEEGISKSIRVGVCAAMQAQPDGLLFSVADQPNLLSQTVKRLISEFSSDPNRFVAPCANGMRGNPVVFPIRYASELCALSGDTGGNAVLRAHKERLVLIDADAAELVDIDIRTEEI